MKKANKKGFTIVELVIVIAVIAILAAVLIPTFASVTNRANESAAMQKARIAYENYLADNADKGVDKINLCIKSGNYYYHVVEGQFDSKAVTCTEGETNGKTPAVAFTHVTVMDKGETFELKTDKTVKTFTDTTHSTETTGA